MIKRVLEKIIVPVFAILFLGAALFVIGGLWITRTVVVIKNGTEERCRNVSIEGGGVKVYYGDIDAGDEKQRTLWARHDGLLRLEAVLESMGSHKISENTFVYVTSGLGGIHNMQINPQGVVSTKSSGILFE